MAIKLLPKREADKAKALDRKREVDEGAKLASRVDGLRVLVAEEEKNLRAFKEKMVPEVMAEIKTLIDRKEYLQADMEELERQRLIAKKPLDDKWLEVRKKEAELNELGLSLGEKADSVNVLLEKGIAYARELEIEKERIRDERERSKVALNEATLSKEKARLALSQSEREAEEIIKQATDLEASAEKREKQVSLREKQVNQQQKDVERDKIAVISAQRVLKDRYDTLQRTIKRLNLKL